MNKIWGILFFIVCITLTGCNQTKDGAYIVALDKLKNANGSYEFAEIPFGKSVSEIEEAIGVAFDEPTSAEEDISSYHLRDVYTLNGKQVKTNLEFRMDKLQSVSFSLPIKKEEIQDTFSKILEELTALYGEADESINKEGDLPELNNLALSTTGYKWVSSYGDQLSAVQLMMMESNREDSTILLSVGLLS